MHKNLHNLRTTIYVKSMIIIIMRSMRCFKFKGGKED